MSLKTIREYPLSPTKLLFAQTPITLDPVAFQHTLVYGSDGNLYSSDGIQWSLAGTGGNQGIQGIQGNQGVQGVQGDFGPAIKIIGSIADVNSTGDPDALLSSTFPSAAIGDSVVDETLNDLWAYVGSSNWENIGDFRGTQGIQGIQGNQGVQGTQGTQGRQGIQGIQGTAVQGQQGIQGISGEQGVQGIQGIDGALGAQGIQGITGQQGIQGTAYLINWVFETSDYTATSRDGVVADTTGGAFNVTLPASPSIGDFVNILDGADFGTNPVTVLRNGSTIEGLTDDILIDIPQVKTSFVYDGTTWQIYPNVGPQGSQGVQGITGAGTQGAQGIQGSFGVQGTDGAATAQGIQGTQGTDGTGTQGVQGTDGAAAAQGIQGIQGVQGTDGTGNQGIQGTDGAAAAQGIQGIQGTVGAQGIAGAGSQGIQGITGNDGTQGIQGIQGTGEQGIQGITGATGTQGTAGVSGANNVPSAGVDKTSSYTLTTGDIGEFVSIGTGGSVTIPSGVFSKGDVVTIYNDTTGNRTITCSAVTAYAAGFDVNESSVTLLTRGVCSILFVDTDVCVIAGSIV